MSSSTKSQCALYRTPSARPCCFIYFYQQSPRQPRSRLASRPAPVLIIAATPHWAIARHTGFWPARIGSYEVPAACTSTIADLSRNLGPLASPPLFLPFSQLVTTRASVASSSSLAFLSGLSGRRARDCLTLACLPSAFDLI